MLPQSARKLQDVAGNGKKCIWMGFFSAELYNV
jgi:hypothetical protein